jgi:hypothetical protein
MQQTKILPGHDLLASFKNDQLGDTRTTSQLNEWQGPDGPRVSRQTTGTSKQAADTTVVSSDHGSGTGASSQHQSVGTAALAQSVAGSVAPPPAARQENQGQPSSRAPSMRAATLAAVVAVRGRGLRDEGLFDRRYVGPSQFFCWASRRSHWWAELIIELIK